MNEPFDAEKTKKNWIFELEAKWSEYQNSKKTDLAEQLMKLNVFYSTYIGLVNILSIEERNEYLTRYQREHNRIKNASLQKQSNPEIVIPMSEERHDNAVMDITVAFEKYNRCSKDGSEQEKKEALTEIFFSIRNAGSTITSEEYKEYCNKYERLVLSNMQISEPSKPSSSVLIDGEKVNLSRIRFPGNEQEEKQSGKSR